MVSSHGFDVSGNTAQRVGDVVFDIRVTVVLVMLTERIVYPFF